MIVDRNNYKSLMGFAGYAGFAETDPWRAWCACAAAQWPNPGERAAMQAKCNSPGGIFNTAAPWSPMIWDPFSSTGKNSGRTVRGLPDEFGAGCPSGESDLARLFAMGKDAVGTARDILGPGQGPTQVPVSLPGGGIPSGGSVTLAEAQRRLQEALAVARSGNPAAELRRQAEAGGGGGAAGGMSIPLLAAAVGGVALLAVVALRRR